MQAVFVVFIGAGAGGVFRHFVDVLAARWWGTDFPFGALMINVAGLLLVGLLVGRLAFKANENWSPPLHLFIATRLLKGYTTFSLETALLIERNQIALAATMSRRRWSSVFLAFGRR
jgi:fluoride exporter